MLIIEYIFILLRFSLAVTAINHWILKDEIVPKLDSEYLLREPGDLLLFLNQIHNTESVEKLFTQLLKNREEIYEHMQFSLAFGKELIEQAKCAINYFNLEKRNSQQSFLRMSQAYVKRLDLPQYKNGMPHYDEEPYCEEFAPHVLGCFDSNNNIQAENVAKIEISAEENITMGDTRYDAEALKDIAMDMLLEQPESWKGHLIASYYWRSRGEAKKALECACRSVTLAPNHVKDIAMLSLGIILFRASCDSDSILTGATQMGPDVAENHFALAASLAVKHDFNRSIEHFDEAERLDPSLLPRTIPMRNFITCFENLSKQTTKMNNYVEFIRNEVIAFKTLKQTIRRKHEAIMHQQIPLGSRPEFSTNDDLQKRGQYCSMRTVALSPSDEPVLFCDFFSEMQMRLESQELDVSSLEKNLKASSESVLKQISKELGTTFSIYDVTNEKNQLLKLQKYLASTNAKPKQKRY